MKWESEQEIVLVVTNGDGYVDTMRNITHSVLDHFGRGVFIAANRPQSSVAAEIAEHAAANEIQYIDCITAMTGIMPLDAPNVRYIESPTMLEKATLRAQQLLRRMPKPAALILDSLSTLAVYNGNATVSELAHNFVTRLRMEGAAAAFILVETQADAAFLDELTTYCDRVVRLQTPDS